MHEYTSVQSKQNWSWRVWLIHTQMDTDKQRSHFTLWRACNEVILGRAVRIGLGWFLFLSHVRTFFFTQKARAINLIIFILNTFRDSAVCGYVVLPCIRRCWFAACILLLRGRFTLVFNNTAVYAQGFLFRNINLHFYVPVFLYFLRR
jgi:hypothetical protein